MLLRHKPFGAFYVASDTDPFINRLFLLTFANEKGKNKLCFIQIKTKNELVFALRSGRKVVVSAK